MIIDELKQCVRVLLAQMEEVFPKHDRTKAFKYCPIKKQRAVQGFPARARKGGRP
jgi:hypothetical protein